MQFMLSVCNHVGLHYALCSTKNALVDHIFQYYSAHTIIVPNTYLFDYSYVCTSVFEYTNTLIRFSTSEN